MIKLKDLLFEVKEYTVTSNVDNYSIVFNNDQMWQKVWNVISNMYYEPKMAQLQRDIKTYDKKTKEVTFRDAQSQEAFLKMLRKEKIIQ